MKIALRVLWLLILFMAYVWLCREMFLAADLDACLDGGGTYNDATRTCSGSRFGEGFNVGTQGPFLFWMIIVGVPALAFLGIDAVFCRLARWVAKRRTKWSPSNSLEEMNRSE
jgi:hypothetical protein